MPPSTIPSTSSAISSPGRRFGSSDQKRRRSGAARPTRHDDSPRPRILTRTPQLDSAVGPSRVNVAEGEGREWHEDHAEVDLEADSPVERRGFEPLVPL